MPLVQALRTGIFMSVAALESLRPAPHLCRLTYAAAAVPAPRALAFALLAYDPTQRAALVARLSPEPGLRCVRAADSVAALLAGPAPVPRPRAVLVVPDPTDGDATLALLRARWPSAGVLLVGAPATPDQVVRGVASGALGFLLPDTPGPQLAQALGAVATGGAVIDPRLARQLISYVTRQADVRRIAQVA
jgi:DNA-binding NarL/FixJ family response regulator